MAMTTGLERDLTASLRWALAYIERGNLIASERPRYDVAKALLKRADAPDPRREPCCQYHREGGNPCPKSPAVTDEIEITDEMIRVGSEILLVEEALGLGPTQAEIIAESVLVHGLAVFRGKT